MKKLVRTNYQRLQRIDGGTNDERLYQPGSVPVSQGLSDHFTIKVKNQNTDSKMVALLAGHYDTATFQTTFTQAEDKTLREISTRKTLIVPDALNEAGFPVDACADDDELDGVSFESADNSKTIRSFREYMHLNPRPLKGLQIVANNVNAFNTTMTVTASSPFQRAAEKTINLIDFVSAYQYQNDRISIDFSENELEVSDITLLMVTIPANTQMSFILRF